MSTQKFLPYFPLHINGNLFTDPELTDLEARIISLAQLMRLQVSAANSVNEQQKLLERFTSSYFAAATGKNRDHIRRKINEMQKNEAVQKYCTIFIFKAPELNHEHIFRFTFKDQLTDHLDVKREKTYKQEIQDQSEPILEWHTETLIQSYLRNIKELSGETARSLIQLIRCDPDELVKGLVYLKNKLRTGTIKNAKAYLIASFSLAGNFKYNIKTTEYLPTDSDVKVNSDFEFEVDKKELLTLEKALKQNTRNIEGHTQFFYRENGTKLYLNKITVASRPCNIKNYLKRADIDFKIVSKVEFENV
jgi:hypothetical protein